ncbi:hypothetical protein LA080_014097 [Diaporthe eres]|uniref:Uncharacterized protein n=1 Tax=Diaporthe vaccinii TaxID=105482 RepID=A0ABR4E5L3_9PEZI|nr:hypothetical protein LA080_014097 [Diaporthe eres]
MQSSKSLAVLLLSSIATALPQEQGNPPQVTLTTITVGLPSSCTLRPTQTITATTGCPTSCSTYADNCWWDYGVELECGCQRMTVEPVTETVCPTVTSCVQCTTAWGITTITPTTCPTPTPTPL